MSETDSIAGNSGPVDSRDGLSSALATVARVFGARVLRVEYTLRLDEREMRVGVDLRPATEAEDAA